VTTAMNEGQRLKRVILALSLSLLGLLAFAGLAQAAAPAWKLLAATGPTNLPPKQSEIQRVTVEAEGGTFVLKQQTALGQGLMNGALAEAEVTSGSNIANVKALFGAPFTVGEQLASFTPFPAETKILAISGSASEPVLELSAPATATESNAFIASTSNIVTGVTTSSGQFHVGDELEVEFDAVPNGTTVTAVAPGTLTLSEYPSFGGVEPSIKAFEAAGPFSFNAPASALQSALEALPAFGPGAVTVFGGPGGTAASPYFVAFGGSFAEQDLEELQADGSSLVGQHAIAHVFTTVPGGPGTGQITINAANVGGAPVSDEYTVHLGPLPAGIVTSGPGKGAGWACTGGAGESTVTCSSTETVPRLSPVRSVIVPIEVESSVDATTSVQVTIAGGAAGSVSLEMPITVSREEAPPGTRAFWAGAFDEDGDEALQAGGHPYSALSYFLINTIRSPSGKIVPAGDSKNVMVDLPPGFAGNPMVTPRCPQSQPAPPNLDSPLCNEEMSVGIFEPALGRFAEPSFRTRLYNDVPSQGYAAEFTTKIGAPLQSLLASVRASEDFGVRITAPNNPNYEKIYGAFAAIEGFPSGAKGKAFLRNATDCAETTREPPVVRTKFDTWQNPGSFSSGGLQDVVLPPVTGCEQLEFQPGFTFQPTSTQGSSPVGATAHLHIPQDGLTDANELGTPDLKRAVVSLPQGLVLNPSSASGLEGCSEAQIGYRGRSFSLPNPIRFTNGSPNCPDGSKLGTVTVDSPLLEQDLMGTIYLANQEENPFGSLIAIYLVVDDKRSGVVLKLPGEVRPDPNTGQLTAIFDHNPQLPFEDMTLHFRGGGPRSQLATPEVCGRYETGGTWTPWSAPESGPPAQTTDTFTVSGNCASSPGARPFSPTLEAGTTDPVAGSYSPLTIKVGRKDGEQELSRFEFSLPPGLSGKLAGIPYCSEAAIAGAPSRTGKQELASSSCPAASRVGRVDTAAGVGSEPFHVGGNVYLAGPYKGAPVSTVVITPAVAGPFDLGNVVVRAPVYIDPQTARLTVKSDPIPTILKGLPLKVRSVAIAVDRSGFTINPTSCEEMSIGATVHSSDGATAAPSNRFQVGNCDALKFTPKLKLFLKGGIKRNANPALTATLTNPPGQANIGKVSVALPHSEFLDQGHIRTICTRVQFAAKQCPKGSIYGRAEAFSPLLDAKLTGPAYLRSSNNKLPDLVIALRGPDYQPVEIELAGRIDSVNGGIRNSFELVPDAPVTKFVLRMQGGKKGLLVNSTNICRGTHKAQVKMTAQNGKERNFRSPLKGQCGKKKATKSKPRKG
jgi:hypothetical protein